ncbi:MULTISPECIES: hypothetical protein [Micromonospora]|uniref:Uncharacterized protein n=1 Tax=Micromonospora sicca TaxID=2202420 RepID=A0A317DJP2_9ACTN|nr:MULTISPECIES: hypothetical protein [unclassified Micromonospora]MBM0224250.1 hypothetical protein [Micromonospora sp. ATA51]PWR13135.1 hypothetical protein DKT69_22035 [Micromonospora sp. 4G51]
MPDLDFFVDVVVSGAVLGVGLTDSPDEVARTLGGDFAEDRNRAVMRRDYGLVEFSWARRPGADSWQATGFTVQAHRLASITVTEALVHRYGPFGRQLRFTQLNAELNRLGYHLQEITDQADANYRRYWLAESRISLLVATTGYQEMIDAGDVWSISAPHPPELVAAGRLGGQRRAVKDGLVHLLQLDEHQRRQWLDRRQPAPHERANWWLYLLLVIDQHLGDQSDRRADWAELKLWLLRQGRAWAVFSDADSAEKLAYFVADMRRKGVALAVLPSADDIVRACLDAIPVGLNEVAVLVDRRHLGGLDRTQMRHSRQARNLVSAAQGHLDEVLDTHLADQLREWIDIKPRLV